MPEKPGKLLPALYGGIVMAVVSAIPFLNCCCCAWALLGGFLSVFFYKNQLTPAGPLLSNGDSIQLGALAGVFGAAIGTVISIILLATVGNLAGEAIVNLLRGFSDQIPPEIFDQIEQSLEQGASLAPFSIIMGFVFSIIIDPLFGLLGGLIGYAVFKQKTPPMNFQPPPMQPPSQLR